MGEYSNKITKSHRRQIPESVWEEISTGKTTEQSEFCNLGCSKAKPIASKTKRNSHSYNEVRCDTTGEKLLAGTDLCYKNKESI